MIDELNEIQCAYARAAAERLCGDLANCGHDPSHVMEAFVRQAKKGTSKYGITLEQAVREGRPSLKEIAKTYALEELVDLAVYFEALRDLISPKYYEHIRDSVLWLLTILESLRLAAERQSVEGESSEQR